MSGGVDSGVAAWLLKKQGYDVVGVFMRSYNLDGCAEKDVEDARRTAEKIGIPFYVWDFEKEYRQKVVEYMIRGYGRGITPNPDVMCNKEIKFGIFLEKAVESGADYVATGHYVKIKKLKVKTRNKTTRTNCRLYQAKDKNKDQSYFLWTLGQKQLRRCLFPIGGYTKPEVRGLARAAGLPVADKKDSQGICFLGKIKLFDFLKKRIPESLGPVVDIGGEKIGEHRGVWFYTIGQRHIGFAGENKKGDRSENKPYYVSRKDVKTNTLIVAPGRNNPALYCRETSLTDINFIRPLPKTEKKLTLLARARYREPLSRAEFNYRGSRGRLVFVKPQKFIAEGQSAVFYTLSGEMLGGGIIS